MSCWWFTKEHKCSFLFCLPNFAKFGEICKALDNFWIDFFFAFCTNDNLRPNCLSIVLLFLESFLFGQRMLCFLSLVFPKVLCIVCAWVSVYNHVCACTLSIVFLFLCEKCERMFKKHAPTLQTGDKCGVFFSESTPSNNARIPVGNFSSHFQYFSISHNFPAVFRYPPWITPPPRGEQEVQDAGHGGGSIL